MYNTLHQFLHTVVVLYSTVSQANENMLTTSGVEARMAVHLLVLCKGDTVSVSFLRVDTKLYLIKYDLSSIVSAFYRTIHRLELFSLQSSKYILGNTHVSLISQL